MKSPNPAKPASPAALAAALGDSAPLWRQLVAGLSSDFPGLRQEWKPSKLEFGSLCLLKLKDRTLLYLIPRNGDFEVSVVLGERAVALALAGDLPAGTKRQLSEARQYAEGRGIRFPVTSSGDVATAHHLVAFKVAPK
jgi:hypothetical protein